MMLGVLSTGLGRGIFTPENNPTPQKKLAVYMNRVS